MNSISELITCLDEKVNNGLLKKISDLDEAKKSPTYKIFCIGEPLHPDSMTVIVGDFFARAVWQPSSQKFNDSMQTFSGSKVTIYTGRNIPKPNDYIGKPLQSLINYFK